MRPSYLILSGLLSFACSEAIFAQNDSDFKPLAIQPEIPIAMQAPSTSSSSNNFKLNDLKVNAAASQPDAVKDPFERFNRKVYAVNDLVDRNFLRPIAVQYAAKVPENVRDSYGQFRKNLSEPWNAVNQMIQLKPKKAIKTLGRFTINTLTSLGFADPARRLGLVNESEDFGTTLGYYGVPSGPFVMLPVFGPSTFRDTVGFVADVQAQPQRQLREEHDGIFWTNNVLSAVDARAQVLDLDQLLQGDRYATLRDLYLQRQNFRIAEKQGQAAVEQASFIEDAADDEGNPIEDDDADSGNLSSPQ